MAILNIFGPPNIEKLKQQHNVGGLKKALAHSDKQVRCAAAEALGELDDSRAIEPLVAALRDVDSQVRAKAAEALGMLRDSRAVEPLVAILHDADWQVRSKAIAALAQLDDPRTVELLLDMLRKDRSGWPIAKSVLAKLRTAQASQGMLAEAWEYIYTGEVNDQISRLGSRNTIQTQTKAIETLAKLDARYIIGPLIGVLRRADRKLSLNALEVLRNTHDPRTVEPLIGALQDEDRVVLNKLVQVLEELADPRAIDPLFNTAERLLRKAEMLPYTPHLGPDGELYGDEASALRDTANRMIDAAKRIQRASSMGNGE